MYVQGRMKMYFCFLERIIFHILFDYVFFFTDSSLISCRLIPTPPQYVPPLLQQRQTIDEKDFVYVSKVYFFNSPCQPYENFKSSLIGIVFSRKEKLKTKQEKLTVIIIHIIPAIQF